MQILKICISLISNSWSIFSHVADQWMEFITRRNAACARFHYPVLLLPKYFIGIILLHIVSPILLPIWVEICVIAYELFLLKITFGPFEEPLHFVGIYIAEAPYIGTLILFFSKTATASPETVSLAWDMRVCIWIGATLVYLWAQVKKWSERKQKRENTNMYTSKRLYIPIFILPLYLFACFSMHRLSYAALPIWVDWLFILVELIILGITYAPSDNSLPVIAITMTGCLFMYSLLFPWFRLFSIDSIVIERIAFFPWTMRGIMNVSVVCLILKEQWNNR